MPAVHTIVNILACARQFQEFLRLWRYDWSTYSAEVRTEQDLLDALSAPLFPDDGAFCRAAELGHYATDAQGRITSCGALQIDLMIRERAGTGNFWQKSVSAIVHTV
jgi:hypothetical protein